jgi:drug/metabolite transporter (DMT)-like permease
MLKSTTEEIAAVSYGVLYAISSAGETMAIKSLNYNVSLVLPAYTALLSNQLWLLMLPIYWMQRKERRSLKGTYWSQYLMMGCLTFTITLLRNISVNVMPGSVFSILISTSILFNIVLSKVVLNKVFTYWHIGAAAFCLAAAFSIGFASLFTNQEDLVGVDYRLGISTAIGAAFFIAVISICQEYIQPTWDNYNVRIVEMTLASSLIASALTVIYGAFTKEVTVWDPAITAATQSRDGLALVVCVSCALPVLKLLVRNTKYATIKNSNAFFFEFAQAAGSLVGSVANVLVFQEPWGVGYIVAIVLMAISFALYIQTKRRVVMPPPPNYPKGDIRIMNPIIMKPTVSSTAKQDASGNIIVTVSLWK